MMSATLGLAPEVAATPRLREALASAPPLAIAAIDDGVVLGGQQSGIEGLGTSRPRIFSLGGDSSTVFFDLSWQGWGSRMASATGRGHYLPPYNNSVPARVVAYSLGRCNGLRSYTDVKVSVLGGGRWTRWISQTICS